MRPRLNRFPARTGVGALQVVLAKEVEDDWFGSLFITTLAVVRGREPDLAGLWELFTTAVHRPSPVKNTNSERDRDDTCSAS